MRDIIKKNLLKYMSCQPIDDYVPDNHDRRGSFDFNTANWVVKLRKYPRICGIKLPDYPRIIITEGQLNFIHLNDRQFRPFAPRR